MSKYILYNRAGVWHICVQSEAANYSAVESAWVGIDRLLEDISNEKMRFESPHNGNAVLALRESLDLNNTYQLCETFGEDSDSPPPRRIPRAAELIRYFKIDE
jgi:hypothetical protein